MTAMTGQSDRARFTSMLRDSIASLCKNGLMFDSISSVEGLIGITLNTQEVFLVNIKEQLLEASISLATGNNEDPSDKEVVSDDQGAQPSSTHRKRRKRRGSKSSVSEITPYSMSTDTSSVNVGAIDNTVATAMTMPDANSLIVIDEIRVKTEHAEQIAEEAFHVQSHDQYLQPNSDGNTTSSSTCVPSTSYVQYEDPVIQQPQYAIQPTYQPSAESQASLSVSYHDNQSADQSYALQSRQQLSFHLKGPFVKKVGKWSCSICEKTFTRSTTLSRHMGLHTGNYPSCDSCGKKCRSNFDLKKHMIAEHGIDSDANNQG